MAQLKEAVARLEARQKAGPVKSASCTLLTCSACMSEAKDLDKTAAKESCWAAEKASLINGISVLAPDGDRSVVHSRCWRPSCSMSSPA